MTRTVIVTLLMLFGVLFIALPSRVRTASAAQESQRFEVATVTPCPPATVEQSGTQFTLGAVRPAYLRIERTRVTFVCLTVESLIHMAYNGGHWGHANAAARDVLGGPSWIRSERYTIEGSAEGVQHPDLTGAMMRSFLEERFQLRVHRGVDNAPMYALKVARGGLKIKPLAANDCVAASGAAPSAPPQTPSTGQQVPCGTFRTSMNGTLRVWDIVPATFKAVTQVFDLDRQLIDKTGVKDRFAIHLEMETVPSIKQTETLIKALEHQLGLTLASTTGRRSWVQIEQIERPRLR